MYLPFEKILCVLVSRLPIKRTVPVAFFLFFPRGVGHHFTRELSAVSSPPGPDW